MICPEKQKCSNTNHKDADTSAFCPSCNKFMCKSCEKFHNGFHPDHRPVPINDIMFGSKIITGRCDISNHDNNLLKYYCKDHNVPCCVACLCPKEDIVGKHSKCQTVPLKEMEQHMKSTLGDIIKKLEDAIKSAEVALGRIKDAQEENEIAKNEIKKQIESCFKSTREAIDAREKELLGLVEELWEKESSCDKLIEIGTECPEKAKQIVEAAKKVEQHWDTNHLPEMAQHYGLVVGTTKELTKFNNDVDEIASKDLIIRFSPEKDGVDTFIDEIKKFGNVFIKPKLKISMKESPNNRYVLEGPNKSVIRKISIDRKWNCTAIGNSTLSIKSIAKWDVKIVSTKEGHIMVGVAPFDIDQVNTDRNFENCGWYFYCYNSTLWSGPPHKYSYKSYGERKKLQNGDVVTITMNTQNGELSFSVNGKELGVAYSGIPLDKPFVPAIDFYNEGDSVEIMF